jgi:plastocyanin
MKRILFPGSLCWILVLAVVMVPQMVKAQVTYTANVGAENKNEARQANAFLPNDLSILENDSITWTFVPINQPHTLTFLMPGQLRPTLAVGCPPPGSGIQPSGSSYDGSACVNSGRMMNGAMYTVKFPKAGNYKLVCLIHPDMNGTVHVLVNTAANASLLHSQNFYDDLARDEARSILSDTDGVGRHEEDDGGGWLSGHDSENTVITTGELRATAGGRQYLSIVRFLPGTINVHVGDTVEWTNIDPTEPHTVTFGTEPANPRMLVGVTTDADGALHGTINTGSDSVNSGFLQAAPQDRVGLAQSPSGTTQIRITFTHAGTYNYICALHDLEGMVGTVVVK